MFDSFLVLFINSFLYYSKLEFEISIYFCLPKQVIIFNCQASHIYNCYGLCRSTKIIFCGIILEKPYQPFALRAQMTAILFSLCICNWVIYLFKDFSNLIVTILSNYIVFDAQFETISLMLMFFDPRANSVLYNSCVAIFGLQKVENQDIFFQRLHQMKISLPKYCKLYNVPYSRLHWW